MQSSLKPSPTLIGQPTIVSIPEPTKQAPIISSTNNRFECTSFKDEAEFDTYVDSISPSRELTCPITQEVLKDPVVAEDGHTYERSALMRWFSMGRRRSPVTNAIMSGKKVFPNLAVQGMAQAHCEKLGLELLERAKVVYHNKGQCPDNGSRIAALLDAGASTTLRDDNMDGNTALFFFLQAPNILLARTLIQHDSSSVLLVNSLGINCLQVIQNHIRGHGQGMFFRQDTKVQSGIPVQEWISLLEEMKKKQAVEKIKTEEKDAARSIANVEHRERQRTMAADLRAESNNNNVRFNENNQQGLGRLEDGWGHFPSLVALQFQSAIPPPSSSVAELERMQKNRLNFILKAAGFLALFFLLWS